MTDRPDRTATPDMSPDAPAAPGPQTVLVRRRVERRWLPYLILVILVLGSFGLGWAARTLYDMYSLDSPFPIVIAEDKYPYDQPIDPEPAPPLSEQPPAPVEDRDEVNDARAIADDLFSRQEYDAAVKAYDAVLELAPGDRDAQLGKARSLVADGSGDAGAEVYWRLLDADPRDVETALELMGYYRDAGQFRSVIATGNALLAAVPGTADVEYWIGRAYADLGDVESAEAWLRAASADGPRRTDPEEALRELGIRP